MPNDSASFTTELPDGDDEPGSGVSFCKEHNSSAGATLLTEEEQRHLGSFCPDIARDGMSLRVCAFSKVDPGCQRLIAGATCFINSVGIGT